jgi:hypothetical protein
VLGVIQAGASAAVDADAQARTEQILACAIEKIFEAESATTRAQLAGEALMEI